MRLAVGLSLVPAALAAREHPVQKLVKVLEQAAEELQTDKEAMLKQSDSKQCWCNQNRKEKNERIALNEDLVATEQANINGLKKAIAAGKTKKEQLETDLKDAKDAHQQTQDEIQKKTKEFMKDSAELTENIQSVKAAQAVLAKHFKGNLNSPDKVLMQVRNLLSKVDFADISTTTVDTDKTQALALLQSGTASKDSIAQVVGVLTQMQEGMQNTLKEKENQWANEKQRLDELLAARKSNVDSLQKEYDGVSTKLAADQNSLKIAKRKIENAQAQLDADRQFLADMEPACKEDLDERNRRQGLMNKEADTIRDVIKILTTDEMFKSSHGAFALSQKTTATSFLQRGSTAVERAVASLSKAAVPEARAIALMATNAGPGNAFDKVLEYIAKLIGDLKARTAANVDQKAVCEDAMRANQGNTIENETERKSYTAKITLVKGKIESLEKTIKKLKEDMEQNQLSLGEMTQDRIAESKEFQQFVSDNQITIKILNKATARMKETYGSALLQAGPSPAGLKKDGYSATRGGGVLALLADVMQDAEANIAKATQEEKTKHAEHVKLFNELVAEYGSNQSNLKQQQGLLAGAHKTRLQLEQDLKDALTMMTDLQDEAQQLAKQCNFFLNNFENMQAAISQEISGLTEAANILRGAQ